MPCLRRREKARVRGPGRGDNVERVISTNDSRAVNPRRAHFNAGTAKNSSGASFAQALRAWWFTQTRFAKQQDFASAMGVAIETVQQWMQGRAFPSDPLCDKLYSLTELDCFSPAGRAAARTEHEQKRGLSHSAIAKRAKRPYLTAEELAECQADPEKAFTIRGDERLGCLECGQLLQHICDFHLRRHGMTAAQYRIGPDPARPRYGPNRALICNALAAKKRAQVAASGNLRPDAGRANLRSQQKGWKAPAGFRQKQSARMRRQRNPEWAKDGADVEFIWPWVIEGKPVKDIAKGRQFSPSGKWARLNAIIGTPVRRRVRRDDLQHAGQAMEVIHRCGGNDARLKTEISRLCEESRTQVIDRTERTARTVMLWLPRALDWWRRNPNRAQAMSGTDLGRLFAAEELPKLKSAGDSTRRAKHGGGRPKGMSTDRIKEAHRLLAHIKQLGGKRGAIRIASAKEYPKDNQASAYDRARKVLQDYRKQFRDEN